MAKEQIKSDKWYLSRIENENDKYFLNIGETKMGRNLAADIVIDSTYCSRNHCTIDLNSSDQIKITDKSCNGTFVNFTKIINDSAQLTNNDHIGIGCTIHAIQNDSENKAYYVFKLRNINSPVSTSDMVNLLTDDENENHEHIDELKKNDNSEEQKDHEMNQDYEQHSDDVSATHQENKIEDNDNNEGHDYSDYSFEDDQEIQRSQQILKEIKEEVNFDALDLDQQDKQNNNDPILIIDDDDEEPDDQCKSWINRLSQNQDKVVEKITKTSTENKPKSSKLIESIEMPKRRKSTTDRAGIKPKEKITVKLNGFIVPKLKQKSVKKKLADDRKVKLSEIANSNKAVAIKSDNIETKEKVSFKPKVKNSESRGAFLTKPISATAKRRMSTSECNDEKKQNQSVSAPKKKQKIHSPPALAESTVGIPSCSKEFVTQQHSDSKLNPIKHKELKTNVEEVQYIDHLDPFALKRKSKKVKPLSIDDALNEIETNLIKTKRRSSRVNSICSSTSLSTTEQRSTVTNSSKKLKSILKSSKNGTHKKQHKNVSFKENGALNNIHYFETAEHENCSFLVNTLSPVQLNQKSAISNRPINRNEFETRPLHQIISDITAWDPRWLIENENSPPVNGVNHVLMPLMEQYPSFAAFQSVIIPLLKHELWASIQTESLYQNKNRIRITINDVNYETRGNTKRYVFHCQVAIDSNSQRIFNGDLVLVENGSLSKFFAYVTDHRFTRSGYTKTTCFTMEAAEATGSANINIETVSITVKPIACIRTEMKLFSAVYSLNDSPMKSFILNPLSYKEPIMSNRSPNFKYNGYDQLNARQLEILESIYNKCLNSVPCVSLIEGPPGTGKSRLIVSIILQTVFGAEVSKQFKILICASSNAAVDIITAKLIKIRSKISENNLAKKKLLKIIRFGVVDSMRADVRGFSLQNMLKNSSLTLQCTTDEVQSLIDDKNVIMSKIDMLSIKLSSADNVTADHLDVLKRRMNQLNETINKKMATNCRKSDWEMGLELMAGANIICTTLSSSINLKQYVKNFDICIIDEASQCIEPWSMVPLQFNVSSLILVGDSQQLPAVVLSSVCRENNLERSLFTRLQEVCSADKKPNMYSLNEQYRMHPEICQWSNKYFYDNRLTSAPKIVDNKFKLIPYGVFSLDCIQSNRDGVHYHNQDEAKFVINVLKLMVKYAHPKSYSYGIITPYSKQKVELQNHIKNCPELSAYELPVNTIDSYQGQEKDIIILSNTRTVGIGFLANPQRLNVAITRAKKCLLICGNFASFKHVRVWKSLLNDAEERKRLHSIPKNYTDDDLLKILLKKTNARTCNK